MGNLTRQASPTWRRPVDAALDYAERGWHVLPCHTPVGNGRCTCGHQDCASIGKHPKLARGLHAASANPDQIRDWWKRWPSANVAIRTGAPSGLVVLDIDPHHGGKDSLQHLIRRHGTPPNGPVVRTGSGGWHLYYTHPGGTIPNTAGTLGPGLDLRGDGGYIIAPPSQHAISTQYLIPMTQIGAKVLPDDEGTIKDAYSVSRVTGRTAGKPPSVWIVSRTTRRRRICMA